MAVLEKLVYGAVRKQLFERLGTMLKEIVEVTNLSEGEKTDAKKEILNLQERAFGEYLEEMRRRVDQRPGSALHNVSRKFVKVVLRFIGVVNLHKELESRLFEKLFLRYSFSFFHVFASPLNIF